MLLEILFGIVIASILFYFGIKLYPKSHLSIWSTGLIIAAVIYCIFALIGKNYDWLSIEFLGVILYSIPALLSKKYSKYWLVLGWALHVLWDVVIHHNGHPGFVPYWYPGVCIGFDLSIAGAIIWSIRKDKAESLFQAAKKV